jgi:hypothetical protein
MSSDVSRRERSWPTSNYYHDIRLKGQRNLRGTSFSSVESRVNTWTEIRSSRDRLLIVLLSVRAVRWQHATPVV